MAKATAITSRVLKQRVILFASGLMRTTGLGEARVSWGDELNFHLQRFFDRLLMGTHFT
jgi:hypothetical protein